MSDTHDIEIVRIPSLFDEIDEDKIEWHDKIVDYFVNCFKHGESEQIKEIIESEFNLNYEGVVVVRTLLAVIDKLIETRENEE